jgi:AcrR family transcriptional regulator
MVLTGTKSRGKTLATRSKKTTPKRRETDDLSGLRARLLDAAFSVFTEHGYVGASMLEIATRAKVSKRELYAQFASKEALFAAGIAANAPRLQDVPPFPPITDRAVLAAVLKTYGAATLTGVTDPHVLAVFRLAIAESAKSPDLARTLNRHGRDANRAVLFAILSEARARKLIASDPPAELVEEFLGLLWGGLMIDLLFQSVPRPSAKEFARRAARATAAFLTLHGMPPEISV